MNELKNDSLGNQIVTEALEWLGTPWFHGQSLKGIGTDCVGFIAGVGIKVGFLPYDFIIENYERIPRNNFLVRFIESILIRVEGSPDKGDVLVFRKSGINSHVGIYLGDGEYIHADSINGVIKTYIHECPPVLIYRVPVSGVVKSQKITTTPMRKIILSLLFLGMMPTVALSLDNQTQEILEKRTCQYLKSGLTLGETARAIRYAVNQNGRTRSEYEGVNILIDEFNRLMTEKILANAKKRCPEFFPRN